MQSVWAVLKLAARAAAWRPTAGSHPVGLPSLLLWLIALGAIRLALQFVVAGVGGELNSYDFNAIVAWLALELAFAALLIPPAGRVTALAAMVALLIPAELALDAVRVAALQTNSPAAQALLTSGPLSASMFAVVSIWWIGAMVAVLRSFTATRLNAALGRAIALWLALVVVTAALPHAPVFIAGNFDVRGANLWEYLHARAMARERTAETRSKAAAFEQRQQSLLDAEVASLAPPKKGATNVYAIGIAGWADQDVFIKELDGALTVVGHVLPIRGHTLRLINNRETTESVPLATQRGFAAAVHAVGAVMDKDKDVLLLLMTSHGEPSGFALELPSEVRSELTPHEVAQVLDAEGIKNRLVIVSACFSGIFVPPLANDNSIVLTASDARNTSFGCAPERDWTYFGDAFFRQSLRPGIDLRHAFDGARTLIRGWEAMDRAPPSNPQGHFGEALMAKVAPFFTTAAAPAQ